MYNLGIYEVIPAGPNYPVTGTWPNSVYVPQQPIIVQMVNRQGYIEIINKSPYDLSMNFVPGGNVVQEASSKCIYSVPDGGQGLTIVPQAPLTNSSNNLTNILVTPPNNYIIVNAYNDGEIQWYAPISLTPAIPSIQQQFGFLNYQTFSTDNLQNGTAVTTAASGAGAQIFLLGFDLCAAPNATVSNRHLTISGIITNFFQSTNNTLVYEVYENATTASAIPEKFPCPILVGTSGASFQMSGVSSGNISLNIYWIVQ